MFFKSQSVALSEKLTFRSRLVLYSCLLTVMMFMLSACGLISSDPKNNVTESETVLEVLEVELEEASADVVTIDQMAISKSQQLGNVALRLLTLEQGEVPTSQAVVSNQSIVSNQGIASNQGVASKYLTSKNIHGYYWLDGIVRHIQNSNTNVKTVEVESVYDGERYIVTESTANTGLLDSLLVGEFVYLNGFYDTFSGFTAVERFSDAALLEKAIANPQIQIDANKFYEFGTASKANKRRQTIEFIDGQSVTLSNETSYYSAYSKQEMTKNAFWRALSKDDSIFMISSGSSGSNEALNVDAVRAETGKVETVKVETVKVETVWLLDRQADNSAVIGTIKEVNAAGTEIVLASEMWQLKDGFQPSRQMAEVSIKLVRKSQVFSSKGQRIEGTSSLETALMPGQQVVVEGLQKNRILEVERLYLKGEKQLPVYAYGTVKGHTKANQTIDLTIEWMFGSEPAKTLEVSVSSFTELFEIGDEKTNLSSEQFWQLLSLNDDVEVEGQIIGNTLEARRLFLDNKQLDLQTLSGTVEGLGANQIEFRLYSYADDDYVFTNTASPTQIGQDLIDLRLANNADIQDIHLAESIAEKEFWARLEPTDQLTVTGYFENSGFVANSVKFEDNDTTPFVFGEVEAFDSLNKQIMLKGKNNVVLLNNKTTIKDTNTGKLAADRFWSKLTIGDNIDIEGSYQDGIFIAKKVFLSPRLKKDLNSLEGEILSFNIRTATLQVKEVDGFVVSVSLAKETALSLKDKNLYSFADFWMDISMGQQVTVTGERFGSVLQANSIMLDKSPVKKESNGFFDWLSR